MAAKVNIFNPEWVDMVFEGKNQDYGAYVLRKDNSRRHLKALIIGVILFVAIVMGPSFIESIMPKRVDKDLTVRSLSVIQLEKPNEADNVIKEVAPPPPVRNTIRFTPPVIRPDEEISDDAEEPKLQKDVIEEKSAIGTVDFDKGTDDVAAPIATTNVVTEEEEAPFTIVEQMPQFPGGEPALLKYLNNSIKYPVIATENGIQGKVYIRFVVGKDGKVSKVEVVRGVDPSIDNEAVRVVKSMPAWSPGRQGGREVSVSYTLPINFVLK